MDEVTAARAEQSAHTPGPYRVVDRSNHDDPLGHCSFVAIHIGNGREVARVWRDDDSYLQTAELFAAAPDLLAALKAVTSLVKHLRHYSHAERDVVCEVARAAIAKAEVGHDHS